MLKDLIYLGLGGALLAKEKMEEELGELVEKGKLSKEEAMKLVEKAKERGREKEEQAKDELKKVIKEVIEELGLATKEDIEDLKKTLKGD